MEENPHLKSAILEVVDNQLKANDPPETRQTFDRLISEGYSEEEAKKLIGSVVTVEIFDVLSGMLMKRVKNISVCHFRIQPCVVQFYKLHQWASICSQPMSKFLILAKP